MITRMNQVHALLMFLGTPGYCCCEGTGDLPLVRQLLEDTLVAAVDTLRMLELLYLVKADVDVPALDVVLIELRQLLDTTELELEARGRPLRVLLGEMARLSQRSPGGIGERL